MAEVKPMTTAELNAEAMKRMDEAKPTPTPEEIGKAKLGVFGDAKLPERSDAQKKADEEHEKEVAAANKRMHESTPTPTQAEIDEFKVNVVERMGGKRSDAEKAAGEEDKRLRAERNAEASERMESSQPSPTQAEVDYFVMNRGRLVEDLEHPPEAEPPKPGQGPKRREATAAAPAMNYRTRAVQPVPAAHEEKKD